MSWASSMNAASSIINKLNAFERPASFDDDVAAICEPFSNLNDIWLFVVSLTLNHDGKCSLAKRTFVTISFETSCLIEMTRILLSLLKIDIHKAYAATNVVIPN